MAEEAEIRENPLIYQRWLFLAEKIEANPELLSIALENISNWRESPHLGNLWALDIWEDLIRGADLSPEGMDRLIEQMRAVDDLAQQLKSCSPFPGVLTTQELDQFTCASVL